MKNPQSRVAKVLASLVGAMTVGTFLLQWIEPSGPPSNTGYAVQLRAMEAKQAVQAEGVASTTRWQGILIRADALRGAAAIEPHFRVTAGGELTATERWRRAAAASESGVIEVAIDTSGPRNGQISARQTTALVALLSELQRHLVANEGRVELDERSFAAGGRADGPAQAQRLRNLLHSAGLSS